MIVTPLLISNFHCSKMPILWASCSMGFLRCPGFSKLHFFNLHKICAYLILTNLIVLIDKLLINICIEYKHVLLLQSTEKKITIFLSVGILEHPPLQLLFSEDMKPEIDRN